MKKIVLSLFILNLTLGYTQSKGFNANNGKYLTQLDSISIGNVESGYAIYIEDYKITEDDKEWLDLAGEKDFVATTVLNKKEATAKFGKDGEKGAIILTPFKDELLQIKYYEGLTNMFVLGKMVDLMVAKEIRENPLFVVDGIPLRGKDIEQTINKLDEETISRISLLNKNASFRIYGIRSLPGVILIFTKDYDSKHPKK